MIFIQKGSLWQYYRDEPANTIREFESFKSKIKVTGNTPNNGNKKCLNSSNIKVL